jgi:hypothetical protein
MNHPPPHSLGPPEANPIPVRPIKPPMALHFELARPGGLSEAFCLVLIVR